MTVSTIHMEEEPMDEGTQPAWEANKANPHRIPSFEGQPVTFATAKLTSVSNLEIEDEVLQVDQMVRMYVYGRVVGVSHSVNERTGEMVRVQTIKVIEGEILDGTQQP